LNFCIEIKKSKYIPL